MEYEPFEIRLRIDHPYKPAVLSLNGKETTITKALYGSQIDLDGMGLVENSLAEAVVEETWTHFDNIRRAVESCGGPDPHEPLDEEMLDEIYRQL